jgi:hypothetical protein
MVTFAPDEEKSNKVHRFKVTFNDTPILFATHSQLDMMLWINAMVRASQPPTPLMTLIPIKSKERASPKMPLPTSLGESAARDSSRTLPPNVLESARPKRFSTKNFGHLATTKCEDYASIVTITARIEMPHAKFMPNLISAPAKADNDWDVKADNILAL